VSDLAEIEHQIGERLARARNSAGLTQQAVADRVGISQASLASYESGRRPVTAAMLVRLANAIGTPAAVLFTTSPEAAEIVAQVSDNPERAIQLKYMLDVLDASGAVDDPQ
jgi:transcriptional regulator with XRE-family HTH domain